ARIEPVTRVPRRPPEPLRAVHVTAFGWADRTLRAGVLALIGEHRINAVELDLKDESGVVGFGSDVRLAQEIGAAQPIYNLREAVQLLHGRGVRVIGRLVCFRDPLLAAKAWRTARRDWVIQTPGGGPYAGYGGFTNFADESVRRYQIAIAVNAARLGVDGTGARVVPWLQDFTLGVRYGPAQVRAEIDAARSDGIDEFLLWDPEVTYTAGALAGNARRYAVRP